MDWTAIIAIVLGSSVLGAVLNNLVNVLLRRIKRSNQATFIALNIAHQFEQYASDRLSDAFDHDNAESSNNQIGEYINSIPVLPHLPKEDYRVFDLTLLDSILDFQQQVHFANKSLSFARLVLDNEEALAEGYQSTLKLASESLRIADEVRQRYQLKKRLLEFGGYSVRKGLKEKLDHIGHAKD